MNKSKITSIIFFTAILFYTFFTIPLASAATAVPTIESATAQLRAGKFKEAVAGYQALLKKHGPSAALFYNLGRAWEESGNRGRAIVNYERAKILAPGDAEVTAALEGIRKANGLYEGEVPEWQQFTQLLSFNQWAEVLLGAVVVLALLQLLRLRWSVPKGAIVAVTATCLVAIFTAGTALWLSWQSLDAMVVVHDSASLLRSPAEGADVVRGIREGRMVYPMGEHGQWVEVHDSTAVHGWLPGSAVESVR